MTFPVVENWRSVIAQGNGLTPEQAEQMLKDLEWAMQKAEEANAFQTRRANPAPARHF